MVIAYVVIGFIYLVASVVLFVKYSNAIRDKLKSERENEILIDTIDSYRGVQEQLEAEVDRLHDVELKCKVLQMLNDDDEAMLELMELSKVSMKYKGKDIAPSERDWWEEELCRRARALLPRCWYERWSTRYIWWSWYLSWWSWWCGFGSQR